LLQLFNGCLYSIVNLRSLSVFRSFFLLLGLVVFLLLPVVVYSVMFFEEGFNGSFESPSSWVEVYDETAPLVFTEDSVLLDFSNPSVFPYFYSDVGVFPDDNVQITVKFKSNDRDYNYGSGIVITDQVLTERVLNTSDSKYKTLFIWPLAGGQLGLFSTLCPSVQPDCNPEPFHVLVGDYFDEWHEWKVVFKDGAYQMYFDEEFVFESVGTDRLPKHVWVGNPEITSGPVNWFSFEVDWVKVESLDEGGNNKVVFLPGLGGSWNTEALITGGGVPDEEWKLTPFFNGYGGLISTFEANGYVQDEDLFVYTYDWRDNVDDISGRLAGFLTDNFDGSDKIDLVGHSLGGLVARNYEQKGNDLRVDKVVTLGSPHQGVVQAYGMWEGGRVGEKSSLSSVALDILLNLQSREGWSGWETVRNQIPVMKDIMPSADFAYFGNCPLSLPQMNDKNNFLIDLNLTKDVVFPKLEAVVGTGFNTPKRAFLGQRTFYDRVLGLWSDGHLLSYGNGLGDGTVLTESGSFVEDSFFEVEVDHRGLVGEVEGVDVLMDVLELGKHNVEFGSGSFSDTLLFLMGSPAQMTVLDPEGNLVVADDQGVIRFSTFAPGGYENAINGEENGT